MSLGSDIQDMLKPVDHGTNDKLLNEPVVQVPVIVTKPAVPVSDLTLSIITCSTKFAITDYIHEANLFPLLKPDAIGRIYGTVSYAGIKRFRAEPITTKKKPDMFNPTVGNSAKHTEPVDSLTSSVATLDSGASASGTLSSAASQLSLASLTVSDEGSSSVTSVISKKTKNLKCKPVSKKKKINTNVIKTSSQVPAIILTWITAQRLDNTDISYTIKYTHTKATNTLRMTKESFVRNIGQIAADNTELCDFHPGLFHKDSNTDTNDIVDTIDMLLVAAKLLKDLMGDEPLDGGCIHLCNSEENFKVPGAFGSCTQINIQSRYNPTLIYRIKFFRNGSINMPGVRDPTRHNINSDNIVKDLKEQYGDELIDSLICGEPLIADAIDALLYVRGYIEQYLGQTGAPIDYFYISMYNFIFRINLQPNTCLNIDALCTYMATKNKPVDLAEDLHVVHCEYDYNKSDRVIFTIDTPTGGELGIYKKEAQHQTYLKFFRRDATGKLAKCNIFGASSREKAQLIYDNVCRIFNDHYDEFIQYIG